MGKNKKDSFDYKNWVAQIIAGVTSGVISGIILHYLIR